MHTVVACATVQSRQMYLSGFTVAATISHGSDPYAIVDTMPSFGKDSDASDDAAVGANTVPVTDPLVYVSGSSRHSVQLSGVDFFPATADDNIAAADVSKPC